MQQNLEYEHKLHKKQHFPSKSTPPAVASTASASSPFDTMPTKSACDVPSASCHLSSTSPTALRSVAPSMSNVPSAVCPIPLEETACPSVSAPDSTAAHRLHPVSTRRSHGERLLSLLPAQRGWNGSRPRHQRLPEPRKHFSSWQGCTEEPSSAPWKSTPLRKNLLSLFPWEAARINYRSIRLLAISQSRHTHACVRVGEGKSSHVHCCFARVSRAPSWNE